MQTIEVNGIYRKRDAERTLRIVCALRPPYAVCRKPNGTPDNIRMERLLADYELIGYFHHGNTMPGTRPDSVRLKDRICTDVFGRVLIQGDVVRDATGIEHSVCAFVCATADGSETLIVDEHQTVLHAYLTEKVS